MEQKYKRKSCCKHKDIKFLNKSNKQNLENVATRTSFTKLLRANRCFRGSRLTWGTTWVLVAKQNLTKHSIKQQVIQKKNRWGQGAIRTSNKQKTARQSKQELSRLLNEQQTKHED